MNASDTLDSDPQEGATEPLRQATDHLRDQVDQEWVEISDRVLQRALTAPRQSLPVTADDPDGPLAVSEQVLITHLRHAITTQVLGAVPTAIRVNTTIHGSYTGLLVQITADYPEPLLPLADRIRESVTITVRGILGNQLATHTPIEVHVADVQRPDRNSHR